MALRWSRKMVVLTVAVLGVSAGVMVDQVMAAGRGQAGGGGGVGGGGGGGRRGGGGGGGGGSWVGRRFIRGRLNRTGLAGIRGSGIAMIWLAGRRSLCWWCRRGHRRGRWRLTMGSW